jgi:tetratricopeptide (TPR) repeat protein
MKTQRIGWVFAVLISLSYLFFTIERQDVWKSNLALWEDTSGKSPHHALPHTNYGLALRDAGRGDEAIRELLIALDPRVKDTETGRAITANNLGLVYMDKEDYKSAERWFRKALDYEPGYGRTYYHLGLIYFIRGEYGDTSAYRTAEEYLKKTLKIYSSYGRAHLLLAKVYIRLGENEKAKEQAKKALQSGLIEPLSKEAQDILNINNKGSN